MNLKLPKLTFAIFAPRLHSVGVLVWVTTFATAAGSVGRVFAEEEAKPQGSNLVSRAARRVQEEPALSADLRYKVDAFGHELVGQGSYLQLGHGPEKLLKLELKMQVADQLITRQEICGPQFYWIRRDSPFAAAALGRVNLRQVRQAAVQQPVDGASGTLASPAELWILLGGLPKLLETLDSHFDFATPRESELQFASAAGQGIERLPVLVLRGHWKPKKLRQLLNGDPAKAKIPEQLPAEVELLLGTPDQVLPLFPYRITFLKSTKAAPAGEGSDEALRPLLTMELFNVYRKGDLDPREFDYNPGEQEVADLTPGYLQRLGLAPKTR
ncbi:MAG: hypothetical protein SFU86_00310 [Pirellulaceae bacterium]|nr:hypothetical protein [Pirellulaceae bacterium]